MYFIYNNKSSEDFNIKIKTINNLSSPQRSIEKILVPGRNGELILDNGSFENFILTVECYLNCPSEDKNIISKEIKRWLQSDFSYKKLILSDDLEFYYEAYCDTKLDFEYVSSNFESFLISFSCKPFKKKMNDDVITITESIVINNPYLASNPLIKVVGSGDVTVSINNQELILKGLEDEIEVDCEFMNAYKKINGDIVLLNNKMYSDFPVLESGENQISFEGNISKIEITPRWVVL
jgi:predicted phage tail component-like protein